jgi:hypothetical protein
MRQEILQKQSEQIARIKDIGMKIMNLLEAEVNLQLQEKSKQKTIQIEEEDKKSASCLFGKIENLPTIFARVSAILTKIFPLELKINEMLEAEIKENTPKESEEMSDMDLYWAEVELLRIKKERGGRWNCAFSNYYDFNNNIYEGDGIPEEWLDDSEKKEKTDDTMIK